MALLIHVEIETNFSRLERREISLLVKLHLGRLNKFGLKNLPLYFLLTRVAELVLLNL